MSENILFGIRLSETPSVFPLCQPSFLVPQTGLEPVRRVRARDFRTTLCHHSRLVSRCSLDSIFAICLST
jgi:hypothetical protein